MPFKIIEIGTRFERLVVSGRPFRRNGLFRFPYLCDCGNTGSARGSALRCGEVRSCGCLQKDFLRQRFFKHGMSRSNLYSVWRAMHDRCSNPNNRNFKNYGGRGIRVCQQWFDFNRFRTWSQTGYAAGLTIERKRVNGNYEPRNCKWIPRRDQLRNKRSTVYAVWNGVRKPIAQWAEELGFKKSVLYYRLKAGWPIRRVFSNRRFHKHSK